MYSYAIALFFINNVQKLCIWVNITECKQIVVSHARGVAVKVHRDLTLIIISPSLSSGLGVSVSRNRDPSDALKPTLFI